MILYDNPVSPYALKVRMALYEKGLDFESREIWDADQRAELLEVNPRGEVPALRDGDTVVYDSAVICEYLEEVSSQLPLLPAAPADRARCRLLLKHFDSTLDACILVLALCKIFKPGLATTHPQAIEAAENALGRFYDQIECELSGEDDYLVGGISLADLALVPHLSAGAYLGFPPDASQPRLGAWLARMGQRSSVARAVGESMAGLERFQSMENSFFENDRLHWRNDRVEWALRAGLGEWLLGEIAADRAFFSPFP